MTDILNRLKHWASIQADGSQLGADLREGVAEIERLRSMAGAVTAGPSLAEIKADLKPASATSSIQMPSGFYTGEGDDSPKAFVRPPARAADIKNEIREAVDESGRRDILKSQPVDPAANEPHS